jgi:hypothetical protein
MTEIYEIETPAGPVLVEAESSAKAVGFARRGIKARRLSGAEVRTLPADARVLDASQNAAEAAGEGDDDADGGNC